MMWYIYIYINVMILSSALWWDYCGMNLLNDSVQMHVWNASTSTVAFTVWSQWTDCEQTKNHQLWLNLQWKNSGLVKILCLIILSSWPYHLIWSVYRRNSTQCEKSRFANTIAGWAAIKCDRFVWGALFSLCLSLCVCSTVISNQSIFVRIDRVHTLKGTMLEWSHRRRISQIEENEAERERQTARQRAKKTSNTNHTNINVI